MNTAKGRVPAGTRPFVLKENGEREKRKRNNHVYKYIVAGKKRKSTGWGNDSQIIHSTFKIGKKHSQFVHNIF